MRAGPRRTAYPFTDQEPRFGGYEAQADSKLCCDGFGLRSAERLERLAKNGFREHIQRKGSRNRPLTLREQEGNKTRSRIRSRVEHFFGVQAQQAGNVLLRTIGIARARAKIGLRNLVYNIDRMGMLLATNR